MRRIVKFFAAEGKINNARLLRRSKLRTAGSTGYDDGSPYYNHGSVKDDARNAIARQKRNVREKLFARFARTMGDEPSRMEEKSRLCCEPRLETSINSYCQGQTGSKENITSPGDLSGLCSTASRRLAISSSTPDGQLAG